jgi:hypothetical protein
MTDAGSRRDASVGYINAAAPEPPAMGSAGVGRLLSWFMAGRCVIAMTAL